MVTRFPRTAVPSSRTRLNSAGRISRFARGNCNLCGTDGNRMHLSCGNEHLSGERTRVARCFRRLAGKLETWMRQLHRLSQSGSGESPNQARESRALPVQQKSSRGIPREDFANKLTNRLGVR
jgi:hypothetical protein